MQEGSCHLCCQLAQVESLLIAPTSAENPWAEEKKISAHHMQHFGRVHSYSACKTSGTPHSIVNGPGDTWGLSNHGTNEFVVLKQRIATSAIMLLVDTACKFAEWLQLVACSVVEADLAADLAQ